MKSEHRHDLQTNELGKFAEKVAVYIDQHGNRLMIGVCVVAIALSGGIFWWRTQSGNKMAAWADLSTAISSGKPELFHEVWNDHRGTLPGLWAKVHEGEGWLRSGVQATFRDVERGSDELKKSRDAFQTVVNERNVPADVRERALLGLGRALESLSDGSEDDAIKAYETLLKEFPKSPFKADAESRIGILKSGRGQDFYTWFSKYPRPKIAERAPHDQAEGESDEDAMSSLKDALESVTKGTGAGKPADDEDVLTLPGEKDTDGKNKPDAAQSQATDEAPAKPDSKPESEPKPDSPAEPETKPE